MDTGFVRYTHRRCEDCDIREDLHASGSPVPKRRHRIAKCATCGGKGEIPLDLKSGLDPYRSKVPPGRAQFYEAKRAKRAHSERHRFRAVTYLFEECELAMQIPPGGFNHGRTKTEEGWKPLESEGMDGDVYWPPSFKHYAEPLKHGTRYAYSKAGCRCFQCRLWNSKRVNSQRVPTPMDRGQVESAPIYARGAFPHQSSPVERSVIAEVDPICPNPFTPVVDGLTAA